MFNCCVVLLSYKHAIDGLYRVVRDEGPLKLMNGATMAASRATLVTIGQVRLTPALAYVMCLFLDLERIAKCLLQSSSFCSCFCYQNFNSLKLCQYATDYN